MDGENNENPYEQMDDLGGKPKTHYFGVDTHISFQCSICYAFKFFQAAPSQSFTKIQPIQALWDLSVETQAAEIIQQFQGIQIFAEASTTVGEKKTGFSDDDLIEFFHGISRAGFFEYLKFLKLRELYK